MYVRVIADKVVTFWDTVYNSK